MQRTRERTCQFSGCTETFTSDGSSRRQYCDEHIGGARERPCAFPECSKTFTSPVHNRKYCDTHLSRRVQHYEQREQLFEEPREFVELKIDSVPDGARILVINDTQRPFHDPLTLEAIERFWDDLKPDYEIYNGDIADFYDISSFDRNPTRRFNLQDELDECKGWLRHRAERNPKARRIFIEGNHEDRLRRWLWKYGKDLAQLRALDVPKLLGFEELGIEGLKYMSVIDFLGYRIEHGYKASASKAYPINVSRYMAIATGSSGLCGHTHRFSMYAWSDASGSHSYIENGCLSRFDLEYAPFPNWQQAFTYGVVAKGKVHLVPVQIYADGFRAEGEFYPRVSRGRKGR